MILNKYKKEIPLESGQILILVENIQIYVNTGFEDITLTPKQARQYAHKLLHAAIVAEKNGLLNNAKH